ncbi:leader peptidase (prepilin peptidase)/N-methyltransferase [Amycolatopsis mediterranei S699]|uniref:Leader peptidase (Prepilin peptidase)/N-methyltransferase n=2 Tax=Amycolatopsis mediterranei TaxID=33910 RepID=A0A0H3DGQ4_AMYMU|nr:leader peptidase (prepilin peptidase)/N-methyltransferase [Amycolatopsis mediterranei U32]AFO80533.1 leader peptidase (prepilin peptidase)/N-methyltransferase [Amycolatopsis mediterranei S699]AGT87661.1 leader peptidase (prepilin peptidase)/N-methyltransferase [Amycolatopsis mediterranei RB]KDU94065.1 peptidase [Amycolatopsis mediterranei]
MVRLAIGLVASLALTPLIVRLLRRSTRRRLQRWFVLEIAVVVVAAGALVALWRPDAIALGAAFVVLGIPAAAVDAVEHRIPDRLSLPLCGASILAAVGAAIAGHDVGSGLRALAGGAVWGAALLVSYLVTGQPGPGDVKLTPSVGILLGWFGWAWVLGGFLAAYILTAVAGVVGVLLRRYSFREGQVPMGPSMIVVAFAGATLAQL